MVSSNSPHSSNYSINPYKAPNCDDLPDGIITRVCKFFKHLLPNDSPKTVPPADPVAALTPVPQDHRFGAICENIGKHIESLDYKGKHLLATFCYLGRNFLPHELLNDPEQINSIKKALRRHNDIQLLYDKSPQIFDPLLELWEIQKDKMYRNDNPLKPKQCIQDYFSKLTQLVRFHWQGGINVIDPVNNKGSVSPKDNVILALGGSNSVNGLIVGDFIFLLKFDKGNWHIAHRHLEPESQQQWHKIKSEEVFYIGRRLAHPTDSAKEIVPQFHFNDNISTMSRSATRLYTDGKNQLYILDNGTRNRVTLYQKNSVIEFMPNLIDPMEMSLGCSVSKKLRSNDPFFNKS